MQWAKMKADLQSTPWTAMCWKSLLEIHSANKTSGFSSPFPFAYRGRTEEMPSCSPENAYCLKPPCFLLAMRQKKSCPTPSSSCPWSCRDVFLWCRPGAEGFVRLDVLRPTTGYSIAVRWSYNLFLVVHCVPQAPLVGCWWWEKTLSQ